MSSLAELERVRDLLKDEIQDINPETRPVWHGRVFQLLIDNEMKIRQLRTEAAP